MSRSLGFCEIGYLCGGAWLSGVRGADWDLHHRRPAGSGGSRLDWIHAPSNLLASCRADHVFVERERLWSIERGLLLKMGTARALTTPVDCRHGYVLLDDVGTWTYAGVPT
jgi:hypothetical protein